MKVLSIGSHPDDVELGMGGTLARHSQRKDDVRVILCTFGGVAGPPKERKKEAIKALGILGIRNPYMLNYQVSRINKPTNEFVSLLREIITEFNPDRVYTHSPYDYHQIHVSVSESVIRATKNVKQILFYETISSTTPDFRPNAFVDITNCIDQKIKSVQAHKTQAFRTYMKPNVLRSLANTRYVWGKVGSNPKGFAEAFKIHKFLF